MTYVHIPVMPREVINFLNPKSGGIYVDGTLGGGGHARMILERILPGGTLIAIDQDADAIRNARTVFRSYRSNIRLFHDNFVNLPDILSRLQIAAVDGILIDLGISYHHIVASGRGFTFQKDEPLDMRMNIESPTRAGEIVNRWSEKRLAELFRQYGEERHARRIARRIVQERHSAPIRSTRRLAEIIGRAVPRKSRDRHRIHPATRTFMALRIAVNNELERLEAFMAAAVRHLNRGGRLCAISFHSLEDRIVKHRMKALEQPCTCPPDFPQCVCGGKQIARVLTRKAVCPTEEEITANPLSRSAKLRALEKL